MTNTFFHKLTIERCQHSLAQLSAALFTGSCIENTHPGGQTVQTLIEILNRDLIILNDFVKDVPIECADIDECADELSKNARCG